MTSAPDITAKILNDILLSRDFLLEGKDEIFSLQEFALGAPLENRAIDLCYGYGKIPVPIPRMLNFTNEVDQSKALAQFEILIGQGITRVTKEPNVIAKLTRVKNGISSLNVTNLLPSNKIYENCYAFANIFVSQTQPSINPPIDNPTSTVSINIVKGATSGRPLMMSKDLDIQTLIEMSRRDEIPKAEGPTNNGQTIPNIIIYNIIIEINYFDPNDKASKDVILHFIDKRQPRGWGGFAEEFMGVYLTPSIVNKNNDYNSFLTSFDEKFYNLINGWIGLRIWTPSFLDYWTNPSNSIKMPQKLKEYLDRKFSIII